MHIYTNIDTYLWIINEHHTSSKNPITSLTGKISQNLSKYVSCIHHIYLYHIYTYIHRTYTYIHRTYTYIHRTYTYIRTDHTSIHIHSYLWIIKEHRTSSNSLIVYIHTHLYIHTARAHVYTYTYTCWYIHRHIYIHTCGLFSSTTRVARAPSPVWLSKSLKLYILRISYIPVSYLIYIPPYIYI